MIPPQLLAGGAALALITGFLGGWTVCNWRNEAGQLEARQHAEQREDKAREQGLTWGTKYAQAQADNAQHAATDRTTIRDIYHDVQVPSDCAAPAAVVGVLSNGIDRANAAASGEPVAAVPGAAPSAEPTDRP